MKALKLVPEQETNTTVPKEYAQTNEADLIQLFPLPRYFQVHFQHIHERTSNAHEELADIKATMNKLEAKLDTLLMLLVQQ